MKTSSAFLFLVVSLLYSFAADDTEVFMISSYHNDKLYRFGLTQGQIAETPKWKEDQPNPPLAPRRAMAVARTYLTKLLPQSGEWPIDKLTLQQVGDRDHWAYLVSFRPDDPRVVYSPLYWFTIVVRMDGQVPEARTEPFKGPAK